MSISELEQQSKVLLGGHMSWIRKPKENGDVLKEIQSGEFAEEWVSK